MKSAWLLPLGMGIVSFVSAQESNQATLQRPLDNSAVYDVTKGTWITPQSSPLSSPSPSPSEPAPITNKVVTPTFTNLPTAQTVNSALGINLFSDSSFVEEVDSDVAKRANLPLQTKTTYESGYGYETRGTNTILSVQCFSIYLQGLQGKAGRVSFLFANKGDAKLYATSEEKGKMRGSELTIPMIQKYQMAISRDKESIKKVLDSLFGNGTPASNVKTSWMTEEGTEWRWRGLSFFLFAPRNEYLTLRIEKTPKTSNLEEERSSFSLAREKIKSRVTHRPNGDVILADFPMVDQGARGYCVPASIERLLRYYGLHADMNMLAMAGKTDAGGVHGTSGEYILPTLGELIRNAGGILTQKQFGGRISDIKESIDSGRPVLWGMYSSIPFNNKTSTRSIRRRTVQDPNEWNRFISKDRTYASSLPQDSPHVCIITGYNEKTREIAFTDSWGTTFTERWMLEEEAKVANQGSINVIE